jgi:hypothetical protein
MLLERLVGLAQIVSYSQKYMSLDFTQATYILFPSVSISGNPPPLLSGI